MYKIPGTLQKGKINNNYNKADLLLPSCRMKFVYTKYFDLTINAKLQSYPPKKCKF